MNFDENDIKERAAYASGAHQIWAWSGEYWDTES